MVLIIIVCAIAWGVCRFKKVDFLNTLFIGFLIGIASIFISGFIGLCTASLTQIIIFHMENYSLIVKKMFILLRRLKMIVILIFLLSRNKIWRKEKIF